MSVNFSRSKRFLVHQKTDSKCWYCGCELPLEKMQIDHIVPHCSGGNNHMDNLAPCCGSCNASKFNMSVEEFRARISSYPILDLHVSQYLKMAMIEPQPIVFYFERMGFM